MLIISQVKHSISATKKIVKTTEIILVNLALCLKI